MLNLKFFMIIVLLVILLSSLILLGFVTFKIVQLKTPDTHKYKLKATDATDTDFIKKEDSPFEFWSDYKYFIVAPSILQLIGSILAGFLLYKN